MEIKNNYSQKEIFNEDLKESIDNSSFIKSFLDDKPLFGFIKDVSQNKSDFDELFGSSYNDFYFEIYSDDDVKKDYNDKILSTDAIFFGKVNIQLTQKIDLIKDKKLNNNLRFIINKSNDRRVLERNIFKEYRSLLNKIKHLSLWEKFKITQETKEIVEYILKKKRYNKKEIEQYIFKLDYQKENPEKLLNDFWNMSPKNIENKIIYSGKIRIVNDKIFFKTDSSWNQNNFSKKKWFCDVFLDGQVKNNIISGKKWKDIEDSLDVYLNDILTDNEKKDLLTVKENCWTLKDGSTIFYNEKTKDIEPKNFDRISSKKFPFTKRDLKSAYNERNISIIHTLLNHLTDNNNDEELNHKGNAILNVLANSIIYDKEIKETANVLLNLVGLPGTGKTIFMNIVLKALGSDYIKVENQFNIDEQKVPNLLNSEIILFEGVKNINNKNNITNNEISTIKNFIDNRPITEKVLYKQRRNVNLLLTPIIVCNNLPNWSVSSLMWRRMLIIQTTDISMKKSDILKKLNISMKDLKSDELAACLLAMLLKRTIDIYNFYYKNDSRDFLLKKLYNFDSIRASELKSEYSIREYNQIENNNLIKDLEYPKEIQMILDKLNLDYVEQLSFIKFNELYQKCLALDIKIRKSELKKSLESVGMKVGKFASNHVNKVVSTVIMPKDLNVKRKIKELIQNNFGFNIYNLENSDYLYFYNLEKILEIKDDLKKSLIKSFKN